jgi:hypothetical protein
MWASTRSTIAAHRGKESTTMAAVTKPKAKVAHIAVALVGERPTANCKSAWDPANWSDLRAYARKVLDQYTASAQKVTLVTRLTPGIELAAAMEAIKMARDESRPIQIRVILPFRGKTTFDNGRRVTAGVDHFWSANIKAVFQTALKYAASVEYATETVADSKAADASFEAAARLVASTADEVVAAWAGGTNITAFTLAHCALAGRPVANVWEQVKDLLPTSDPEGTSGSTKAEPADAF